MAEATPKITAMENGPYQVLGSVPLVRKTPIKSDKGEAIGWQTGKALETESAYYLCRCGASNNKPFCDGTHRQIGFDGTETAATNGVSSRQTDYPGTGIVVKDDRSLCIHAGFCVNELSNVWQMTQDSTDPEVRAQIMKMIDQCPSGALAYALEAGGDPVEIDLPKEIALTPDGALWVTGGIPVVRSDGQPCEVRNRVTLCRCGASKNKPFCDGAHEESGFTESEEAI
jgi:CDGSH-type Zn-finger protein/ferredoxin